MKRLAFLVLLSCGQTVPQPLCGPSNCEGCCATTDECRLGTSVMACGTKGAACDACVTGQVCAAGICGFPQPMPDGGMGGGGGSGGGSAGGGSGGGAAGGAGGGAAGGSGGGGGAGGGGGSGGGGSSGTDGGMLCAPKPIDCSDQAIQNLDLKKTVNTAGAIVNVVEDAGFRTTIDATAGGVTPTMSFVYGKFGDGGMNKVLITDEVALDSMDWDIAFRRFVIRLNSGASGPSCVKAAVTGAGTNYDTLMGPVGMPPYVVDDFETLDAGPPPSCAFKDDNSGLPTSPSTALANANASFYNYNNCVQTTGRVFVVQTREGRHVKLVVTNYYPTDQAQQTCNMGTNPGVAGATIRVRWSWLD